MIRGAMANVERLLSYRYPRMITLTFRIEPKTRFSRTLRMMQTGKPVKKGHSLKSKVWYIRNSIPISTGVVLLNLSPVCGFGPVSIPVGVTLLHGYGTL